MGGGQQDTHHRREGSKLSTAGISLAATGSINGLVESNMVENVMARHDQILEEW